MRCEEVVELMQRHLDRDLNDEETKQMKSHADTCPDCSDMLRRLEQLNEDLENLPKVTPAYSLVDSILPKLKEIDAAGLAGETQAAAVEDSAERNIVTPLRRKKHASRSPAWKAAGVVAAGLLLGVMIFSGLPKTNQDRAAESASEPSSGMETSSEEVAVAESFAGSMESTTEESASADTAQDQILQADSAEKAASKSAPKSTSKAASKADQQTMPREKQSLMPEADRPTGGASKAEVPEQPAGEGADTPKEDRNDAVLKEALPLRDPDQGVAYGITAEPSPEPPENAEDADQNKTSDGNSTDSFEPVYSANDDGTLLAFVEAREDGSVGVKITDKEGGTVFVSERSWGTDDVIRFEGWSGDVVRYTVETANGTQTFAIDAKAGSETEENSNRQEIE